MGGSSPTTRSDCPIAKIFRIREIVTGGFTNRLCPDQATIIQELTIAGLSKAPHRCKCRIGQKA
jgi:hypothetical protein